MFNGKVSFYRKEDAVMRIETKRLVLRELLPEDAASLQEVLGDPAVMRFLEPPFSPEKTARFIREAGMCRPPLVYALTEKSSGGVIGHVIFHPFVCPEVYEIGWVLGKKYWRHGYAYEISTVLMEYAFQILHVRKLVAETVDPNASLGLMKKLGMNLEDAPREADETGPGHDLSLCGLSNDQYFSSQRK